MSRTPASVLLDAWHSRPTPERARALCDALRERPWLAISVVDALAADIVAQHGQSAEALVALARLQLVTERFEESIDVLVAAGRLDPTARAPYRLLGEALLHRGDAVRAERLFEHAVTTPKRDEDDAADDADGWLRLTKKLVHLQAMQGERAVAAEMARLVPSEVQPSFEQEDEATERTAAPVFSREDRPATRAATVSTLRDEEEDAERTARQVRAPQPFDAGAAAAEIEVDVDDEEYPTNIVKPARPTELDHALDSLFEDSVIKRPG